MLTTGIILLTVGLLGLAALVLSPLADAQPDTQRDQEQPAPASPYAILDRQGQYITGDVITWTPEISGYDWARTVGAVPPSATITDYIYDVAGRPVTGDELERIVAHGETGA